MSIFRRDKILGYSHNIAHSSWQFIFVCRLFSMQFTIGKGRNRRFPTRSVRYYKCPFYFDQMEQTIHAANSYTPNPLPPHVSLFDDRITLKAFHWRKQTCVSGSTQLGTICRDILAIIKTSAWRPLERSNTLKKNYLYAVKQLWLYLYIQNTCQNYIHIISFYVRFKTYCLPIF